MNAESLQKAFRDLFPHEKIMSYKRVDPHSIEVTTDEHVMIFTYYGPKSWKLETK